MIKTVSLETAKALKEAGFRQDTYFSHADWSVNNGAYQFDKTDDLKCVGKEFMFAAPTTDELLEELEKVSYESHGFPALMIFYALNKWNVCFRNPPLEWIKNGSQEAGTDTELCESCAKMWLWLKQQSLLN